ncbi:hypothetical protein F5Y07DRAFT_397439 [Xylaria sp. FL0933]|nr:hypothetical protein F5Y07DRAFT_397439 [Xylaria sp. FL0933]
MKTSTFLAALCASLASAGVVRTPIFQDQVVPNVEGDCFFGVSTPTGCGWGRSVTFYEPLLLDATPTIETGLIGLH